MFIKETVFLRPDQLRELYLDGSLIYKMRDSEFNIYKISDIIYFDSNKRKKQDIVLVLKPSVVYDNASKNNDCFKSVYPGCRISIDEVRVSTTTGGISYEVVSYHVVGYGYDLKKIGGWCYQPLFFFRKKVVRSTTTSKKILSK